MTSGQAVPPEEFGRIARHFRPLAAPGGLDLLDDAALLTPPPGRDLVLTADAMVAGVHFLPDDPPDLVARKLLRVNLSDLAAMGATPLHYLLTVSAPKHTDDAWFAAFASGLAQDQQYYKISLLGGDTTHTPGPLTLSLTAIGHVAPNQAVRRTTARPGDHLYVTGTIGDGALGLLAATGQVPDPGGHLADRYRLPRPRLGVATPSLVHAAMDISDGLVQDLAHMLRAAGLGAVLHADQLPLSPNARTLAPTHLETILTGGDDYELLLAIPPEAAAALSAAAHPVPITMIGQITQDPGLDIELNGRPLALERSGWSHF